MNKLSAILVLILVIPMLIASGCNRSRAPQEQWRVGGLYSVQNGREGFGVIKILALDSDAVHIRIYKQTFSSRPGSVDPNSLTLGRMDDKDGFSIGHVPLSPETFKSWAPVFLSQQAVSDSELEGYKMWKDANGGKF